MATLEIDIAPGWPAATDWSALATRALEAITRVVPELGLPQLEVSVLFADDADIRDLNAQWRAKNSATNVLSFPMLERSELLGLDTDGPPVLLGDVALAYETCAREAAEKRVSLADHASHLIVHGLLHLAGYDHEISAAHAKKMEHLEIKALALIGIADPYQDGETEE